MIYYIVRQPTDDEKLNLYILYKLSFHKDKIIGVYYLPKIRYYGPVITSNTPLSDLTDIAYPVNSNIIENGLRMICIRCGWCCERDCGAFMFEHEAEKLNLERWSSTRAVRLVDGSRVKIYYIDSGPEGSCIFYDSRRRLCRIHEMKPIICMITYCARYAVDREGNIYRRVGKAVRGVVYFKKVQSF